MPDLYLGYMRVSSQAQAKDDRFGFTRQDKAIRAYVSSIGGKLVKLFQDAISGAVASRDNLEALKRYLKTRGDIRGVVISETRALGRHQIITFQCLGELFETGLPVHSADMGLIDLDDESSTIQFNMRSMGDHLERQKTKYRTYKGRLDKADKGKLPQGIRCYGYRFVNNQAVIHPQEAKAVKVMYSLRPKPFKELERVLNASKHKTKSGVLWRASTIRQTIVNPVYKGEYHWKAKSGTRVIKVPPLVTPQQWKKAQPTKSGRHPSSGLVLVGHVRCGVCGHRLSAKRKGVGDKVYYSYRCNSHVLPQGGCTLPYINRARLEETAEQKIREAFANEKLLKRMFAAANSRHADHDGLRDLEREDKELLDAFRKRAISASELALFRKDLRKRMKLVVKTEAPTDLPIEAYMRAAKRLSFANLLKFAGIEITVFSPKKITIAINAL